MNLKKRGVVSYQAQSCSFGVVTNQRVKSSVGRGWVVTARSWLGRKTRKKLLFVVSEMCISCQIIGLFMFISNCYFPRFDSELSAVCLFVTLWVLKIRFLFWFRNFASPNIPRLIYW